jgi:hypothetical protein
MCFHVCTSSSVSLRLCVLLSYINQHMVVYVKESRHGVSLRQSQSQHQTFDVYTAIRTKHGYIIRFIPFRRSVQDYKIHVDMEMVIFIRVMLYNYHHHHHHHHHHLPPWIRSFDLFRHLRVSIFSWGVHNPFYLGVCRRGSVSGSLVLSIFSTWLIQFCLRLAVTSCIAEIFSSFHMTSLLTLSSLVYHLTLLRKRISAASRRVISRFVVNHASLHSYKVYNPLTPNDL